MKIWCGPVGRISRGHVLDVAQKPLEQALKDHDSELYIRWNSRKLKGHGCWEIRRRGGLAVADITKHKAYSIVRLEHCELDVVNHVLDAAFLNYDLIRKIKEMDAFNKNHWVHRIDELEAETQQKQQAKARDELKHSAKEYRREIRDFKEFINSGGNPNLIGAFWGQNE